MTATGVYDGVGNRRKLQWWYDLARIGSFAMVSHKLPKETGIQMRAVVAWVTRDDAVEIFRIALRFHQRLMAASGTARKIRVTGRAAVEFRDNRLCSDYRSMDSPVPPIDDRFWMILCKVGIIARMAGISTKDRVAAFKLLA